MFLGNILFSSIILFIVIYFAVSMAIKPLIPKQKETVYEEQDMGLVKLRDMNIINPNELDEVIKLYRQKGLKAKSQAEYSKYEKVLTKLKELGYFSYEEYISRIEKLKAYYKIDK